jgi:hypothetical protein
MRCRHAPSITPLAIADALGASVHDLLPVAAPPNTRAVLLDQAKKLFENVREPAVAVDEPCEAVAFGSTTLVIAPASILANPFKEMMEQLANGDGLCANRVLSFAKVFSKMTLCFLVAHLADLAEVFSASSGGEPVEMPLDLLLPTLGETHGLTLLDVQSRSSKGQPKGQQKKAGKANEAGGEP